MQDKSEQAETVTSPEPAKSRLVQWVKLVLFVALLGGAFYFFRYSEQSKKFNVDTLRQYVESQEPYGPLVYVGIYVVGTIVLFPGTLLSFPGAVLFGPYWGTLYTWIGATIGACGAYGMAKLLGRDSVKSILGDRIEGFDRRVEKHGFYGMVMLRLLAFPFNLLNFASGLTKIRFRDYALGTALGILPGTFVFQLVFSQIAKLGRRDVRAGDFLQPELFVAVGLLIVLIFGVSWLKRRLEKKGMLSETASQ